MLAKIDRAVDAIPTRHDLYVGDSRSDGLLPPASVHLALTSPRYRTLKRYHAGGGGEDFGDFVAAPDRAWRRRFEALVPGGRLVCVVGDVWLSRRDAGVDSGVCRAARAATGLRGFVTALAGRVAAAGLA